MSYKGGAEKRINTYTLDNQGAPQLARLKDGGWVASWVSSGEDGDSDGIYHQRFNADGSKRGGETHVSTTTEDRQFEPAITALSDGGWLETWSSRDTLATSFEIYQQAYNANGKKVGQETRVNDMTAGEQSNSEVTALKGGGWVVTWQTEDDHEDAFDIHQRVYDKTGAAIGEETLVNTVAKSDQFDADVAGFRNGGWVVTWSSYGHKGDASGIFQQIFKTDGTALGGEHRVNSHKAGNQYDSDVAVLKDGSYLVSWESQDQDGSDYGIYQQRFDADGDKLGQERRVNTHTALDQKAPDVAALANGGWVVAWQSDNQDGNAYGIYAQAYHADGSKDGKEFRVNQHTNSEQMDPSVTALEDGRFVVSWQSYDVDGDEGAIMQRIFKPGQQDAVAAQHSDAAKLVLKPIIDGTNQDDTLQGKDYAEIFRGKAGNDTISGRGGNDTLDGGTGNDLLVGGDGKDLFIFKTGYGHDTVRGFFDGDRIDLSKVDSIAAFDDLMTNHASQVGADVYIDAGDGDTLFIRHALKVQLEAGDFIFG
jgi:hypothetical protein